MSIETPETETELDVQQTQEAEQTPVVDWNSRGIIGRIWYAKKNNTGKKETLIYYVRETVSWVFIFVLAFIIAVMVNMYVVRLSNVVGDSMLQTYKNGDRVVLSQMPYVFGEPEPGDIIVFDSTGKERTFGESFKESCRFNLLTQMFVDEEELSSMAGKYYIKRIIAVEGDFVEIKENKVFVNGTALKEDYVNPDEPLNYSFWEGKSWTVGEDELFVMGDNRNHSQDSRNMGPVPEGCILGKVVG